MEGSVDLLVVLLHCADHLLNEGAALSGGGGGGGAVAGLCGCHCDCFVCLFWLCVRSEVRMNRSDVCVCLFVCECVF